LRIAVGKWRLPVDRLDVPAMAVIAVLLLLSGIRLTIAVPLWTATVIILRLVSRRIRSVRAASDDASLRMRMRMRLSGRRRTGG
jgi:hypothetical protein